MRPGEKWKLSFAQPRAEISERKCQAAVNGRLCPFIPIVDPRPHACLVAAIGLMKGALW
jgi:hypothetical protein